MFFRLYIKRNFLSLKNKIFSSTLTVCVSKLFMIFTSSFVKYCCSHCCPILIWISLFNGTVIWNNSQPLLIFRELHCSPWRTVILVFQFQKLSIKFFYPYYFSIVISEMCIFVMSFMKIPNRSNSKFFYFFKNFYNVLPLLTPLNPYSPKDA